MRKEKDNLSNTVEILCLYFNTDILSNRLWAFCFVGDSSKYSTMFLEEHNVLRSMRNGFCVFDSRGLDYDNVDEGLDDVCSWMKDGVRHYQQCWRPSDGDASSGLSWFDSPPRYAKRRVNCAVVVVSVAEIYGALKGGDPKPLEATKELFYCHAIRKCCKLSFSLSPILFETFLQTVGCHSLSLLFCLNHFYK